MQRRVLDHDVIKVVWWIRNEFLKVEIELKRTLNFSVYWIFKHLIHGACEQLSQLDEAFIGRGDEQVKNIIVDTSDERNTEDFWNKFLLLHLQNFDHSIVHLLEKRFNFHRLFLAVPFDWDFYEWFYCISI